MTPNDSRPPGCTSHTPFEEELVNAMNDFANSADTPAFDTPGIMRKTRRKRATAIAGVAAALIVAGGGTALATAVTHGSNASKPATATVVTSASTDKTTLLYGITGAPLPIQLGGMNLDMAKAMLMKTQTKLGTVSKTDCGKNGKPGAVSAVDPHSPKIVAKGDTVNLTLCAG
jgi:hypothetical protein